MALAKKPFVVEPKIFKEAVTYVSGESDRIVWSRCALFGINGRGGGFASEPARCDRIRR